VCQARSRASSNQPVGRTRDAGLIQQPEVAQKRSRPDRPFCNAVLVVVALLFKLERKSCEVRADSSANTNITMTPAPLDMMSLCRPCGTTSDMRGVVCAGARPGVGRRRARAAPHRPANSRTGVGRAACRGTENRRDPNARFASQVAVVFSVQAPAKSTSGAARAHHAHGSRAGAAKTVRHEARPASWSSLPLAVDASARGSENAPRRRSRNAHGRRAVTHACGRRRRA
jgi:hypothetical protein